MKPCNKAITGSQSQTASDGFPAGFIAQRFLALGRVRALALSTLKRALKLPATERPESYQSPLKNGL
jgi:hypothetical protein